VPRRGGFPGKRYKNLSSVVHFKKSFGSFAEKEQKEELVLRLTLDPESSECTKPAG